MGLEKLTVKLQEALQQAQRIASKSAHPELKSNHVLLALLTQEGGIASPLLEKAGIDLTRLKALVAAGLEKEPRVQGAGSQPQMSYGLRASLDAADLVREEMGDDFLSVEHFILGSFKSDSPAGEILKEVGLTEESLTAALKEVRGSHSVTDDNPEGKYEALERYGLDLTCLLYTSPSPRDLSTSRMPSSA